MKQNADNQIWDPERAYRESRSGNLRLLIALLVIIAIGAAWITGILAHQKRTGEVKLNASMTFEDADRLLRDSGYNPMGLSFRKGNKAIQTYDSRRVFSCLPVYSMLESEEENNEKMLRLDHVFMEDGKHSMADPGEICRTLRENLTKLHGAPEEKFDSDGKYLQWKTKDNGRILLGYMDQSMPVLCYIWTDSESSMQI